MTLEKTIEQYNDLRRWALSYIRRNTEHFVDGEWFKSAINDSDITLSFETDTISGFGHAYTMQTMDNEWFEFRIPLDLIPADLKD